MTATLSPRAAAQKAVDQMRKLEVNQFDGGRWMFHEDLDVVLLDPPRHTFIFAFHRPTLKFFRSATRNSQRLTSSSLRTIIDPERSWIVNAMKSIVPDGQDFLAYERGDQSVMDRRAAVLAKLKESSDELEPVQSVQTPPSQPVPVIETRPTTPESLTMSLLDVQTATKKIVIEEISRTLDLERKQLVTVLRAAGAPTMKRSSKIRLITADGKSIELDDGAKLRIEWADTIERTEE